MLCNRKISPQIANHYWRAIVYERPLEIWKFYFTACKRNGFQNVLQNSLLCCKGQHSNTTTDRRRYTALVTSFLDDFLKMILNGLVKVSLSALITMIGFILWLCKYNKTLVMDDYVQQLFNLGRFKIRYLDINFSPLFDMQKDFLKSFANKIQSDLC